MPLLDKERRLSYDRRIVPQETGWWCGPASVHIALNAKNIHVTESSIAHEIEQIENPGRGDDKDGTDYIGLIEIYLDRKVPEARYTSVQMPKDPPTKTQIDKLWKDSVRSIDAGWAVIINIVAPPNNPPAAIWGSKPPPYPKWSTTWHYMCVAGYAVKNGVRGFWIADPANFGGISGWWCPLEGKGSVSTLIPPKGYCYSDSGMVIAAPVEPPAGSESGEPTYTSTSIYRRTGEPQWTLAEMIVSIDGMRHRETVEDAARYGDLDAIDRIAKVAAGKGAVDAEWAVNHAKAVLETIPPQFLEYYVMKVENETR